VYRTRRAVEAVVPIPITFHIYEGDQLVRTETFAQDVIKIGKLDSSHLRIDDAAVSRMHSVIEVSGPGEVYIIDLGSASGTVVNGQRVNKARLESGDQLQFGNSVVVVEVGAEVEDQAAQQYAAAPAAQAAPQYQDPAPVARQRAPIAQTMQGAPAFTGLPQPQAFAQPQYAQPQYAQPQYAQPQYQSSSAYGAGASDESENSEMVTFQMVPTAPPVNPADIDSSESAVEVIVMWGELSILHVEHMSPPRSFYVGESTDAKGKPTTDFLIGSESIGTERLPVAIETGSSVAVVVPNGASGDVTINNQSITFEELAAQGQLQGCSELAGAAQYLLPPGATARVQYRGFTFIVKPMSAARRVGIGGSPTLNLKEYMWTVASMAFHIGLLLLFYFLPPRSSSLSLDLLNADSRLVKYLIEPPETEEQETPEWLDESKMEDDEGGKGKRHKDE